MLEICHDASWQSFACAVISVSDPPTSPVRGLDDARQACPGMSPLRPEGERLADTGPRQMPELSGLARRRASARSGPRGGLDGRAAEAAELLLVLHGALGRDARPRRPQAVPGRLRRGGPEPAQAGHPPAGAGDRPGGARGPGRPGRRGLRGRPGPGLHARGRAGGPRGERQPPGLAGPLRPDRGPVRLGPAGGRRILHGRPGPPGDPDPPVRRSAGEMARQGRARGAAGGGRGPGRTA